MGARLGILGQPVASAGHLCLGHLPAILLMCSTVSLALQELPWVQWPMWRQCCLAPSESAQFSSQALWVGASGCVLREQGRSTHHMCALSSGAEAKTILPKKEKLKLRRERWLQSKCVPGGDVA